MSKVMVFLRSSLPLRSHQQWPRWAPSSASKILTCSKSISNTRLLQAAFFSTSPPTSHQQPSGSGDQGKKNRKRAVLFVVAAVGTGALYLVWRKWFNEEVRLDLSGKPKLVVLGTGWGAVGILKKLIPGNYDVTVVSPHNYFLFTPLLPSATVGSTESRSLMEPIRKILYRLQGTFMQGVAEDIDFERKLVRVKGPGDVTFDISYDKLVIAVGAETNTFGIPGVKENCNFLKSIKDARRIRLKIIENFENASLPSIDPKERQRLLHFVVVGGGPTGVEFAAELYDLLNDDLLKYFPNIRREEVRVTILEGLSRILNMFDESIIRYTEKAFHRQNIEVKYQSMVTGVNNGFLTYKNTLTGDSFEMPFGMCVWGTGIGTTEFVRKIKSHIPEQQKNQRAIIVDSHLAMKGIEDQSVFAIGDCSTIEVPKLFSSALKLFEEANVDSSGYLSKDDFDALAKKVSKTYPIIGAHFAKIDKKAFKKYASNKPAAEGLSVDQFQEFLAHVDKSITSLPPTAQVASQQGKYIGIELNMLALRQQAQQEGSLVVEKGNDITGLATQPIVSYKKKDSKGNIVEELSPTPFRYKHLGTFVYIGDENAVYDLGLKGWTSSGYGTFWLWRSIFLSEQVSFRTRALIAFDIMKTLVFGRDISKVY